MFVEYPPFEKKSAQQIIRILKLSRHGLLFEVFYSWFLLMSTIRIKKLPPYGIFGTDVSCLLNIKALRFSNFGAKGSGKIAEQSYLIAGSKQGRSHCKTLPLHRRSFKSIYISPLLTVPRGTSHSQIHHHFRQSGIKIP